MAEAGAIAVPSHTTVLLYRREDRTAGSPAPPLFTTSCSRLLYCNYLERYAPLSFSTPSSIRADHLLHCLELLKKLATEWQTSARPRSGFAGCEPRGSRASEGGHGDREHPHICGSYVPTHGLLPPSVCPLPAIYGPRPHSGLK